MRIFLCAMACSLCLGAAPKVSVVRCPNDGIQPQAAVDSKGRIHAVYLKGPDGASDIFYVRSDDAAATWTPPIRVNSHEGAAIAAGTVRGAHLALGRGGEWVHVAWMGSGKARPRGPGDSTPMLYARMKLGGGGFEGQRNVIAAHPGRRGGGGVAGGEGGNVGGGRGGGGGCGLGGGGEGAGSGAGGFYADALCADEAWGGWSRGAAECDRRASGAGRGRVGGGG